MDILDRYNEAVNIREEWNNVFYESGKYCWPQAKNIVKSVKDPSEGEVLTVDIADSTAIKASLRMTSGIFSYLMPVGVKWFDFRPSSLKMRSDRGVQRRASVATQSTQSAIWRSNFQREMFTTIRSLIVFGTGCISVEMVDGNLVYRNYHIADIFFEENSKGIVDTVFRRAFYTARQMRQEFGEDNLSKAVKDCLKARDYSKKFEVVHCVYPREDYDSRKLDQKKYVSEWKEVSAKNTLKEGGFKRMPYKIGRFDRSPDELMGRGPAFDLLPDIKMLNNMRYTFVLQSEKAASPPLIIEDDGVIGQPSTGPDSIIVKRHGADDPRPLQTGANPQLTAEVISMERQGIMEGFHNDLFQALAQYRNMTATEVVERVEEKMVMLAPAISGLQKELWDPLISDSKDLLVGTEELPEDVGVDLDVVYQGRLALAMSNMQTNAIEATIAKWSPYQQFYPVLDNLDIDKAFVTSALNAGVPAEVVLDKDAVDAKRKASQEMEQAAAQADIAATGSQAIKNIQGSGIAEALGV